MDFVDKNKYFFKMEKSVRKLIMRVQFKSNFNYVM